VSPPGSHHRQAKEPHGIFRLFFAIELWQSPWAGNAKMRLLLRVEHLGDRPMVVEANIDHQFLERAHKLVLICQKIRRTMNGPAKVTIDNSRGNYVLLESEGVVRGVMAKAGVKDWQAVQYLVIPEGLLLGNWGPCLVMAGMRSQTVIDQDGLWFQGADGTCEYVSVKVDRQGLNRLLALEK